ncbi:ABC-2 family transporter protein [Paenibacillus sp. HB172176]|uniref:ABC transporter permease n=1 Tax=Paenibacillus sp. HB172176 TaxID=2493690 RepID=UPI00143902FF|nr:ABC-2 family transporter protein [Paenibacillus sp. HB172176]
MRVYVEFIKLVFRRNAAYKTEYFMSLFNALLGLFITVSIWEAAFGDRAGIDSITKEQMITYAVIAILMRTLFTMNEFVIDRKIQTGEIAVDLLKPYKFMGYILTVIIGDMIFNLWTKVLPVLIVSVFVFHLLWPDEASRIIYFALSLMLGFLELYLFNLLFWLSAFWIHHTWSLVTIKNAVILLVSGATIPLWFIPERLSTIFSYLPFKDIYYTPLSIYLGKVPITHMMNTYLMQLGWIALLFVVAFLLWRLAQNKLIIQGG